jgi:AcrR family transcriptional regulator
MARRSAADAAKTRARILQEAEKLFTDAGFAATSTAAIANAAEVTDGAVFHHFKSKKALFEEIAIKLHTDIHRAIYHAGLGAANPIEGFKLGARKSMQITQEPRNRRIVFIEAPVVLGTEKWRKVDQQLGLRLIEGGLKAVAEADDVPDHILKPMAMLALGSINEVTYALIREEKGVDPEQCLNLLERTLNLWLLNDVAHWKKSQQKP